MNKLLLEILRSGDEASVRKAQTLFEKTEHLARLGYWEWDEIEDRCVFCSPGLAEIAGVTQEEYLIQASSFEGDVDWAHPDDRARYRETVSQAIAERKSFQIEYRFLRPDGRAVEVYEEAEPVFDRDGRLIATRGFVQDISRRKSVERALQEARRDLEQKVRLRTAELQQANESLRQEIAERRRVEADLRAHQAQLKRVHAMAKIGVFVWDDVALRPIYYSDELADLLGMSTDELLQKRATCEQITRSIDPRDRAAYNAAVERAEEACTPYTVEYRTRLSDGEIRYWRELGEPILDEQGRLLRTLIAIQDITEMRRAEEALRASEERLKLAIDLAGLGHWIWDPIADRCLYCSDETARIHGVTPQQYMQQAAAIESPMAYTHPDDCARYVAALREVRRGRALEMEYRIVRPNGEVRYVREMIRPIFDSAGRVVQEIGTIQDISEIKAAEEQLRQAQKMEAIGQLTGGVAHDFNNLLAIIQGNAELLAESDRNRETLVAGIQRAAASGAKLTQRLLAFSRRQPLSPRPLDLAEVVNGLCDMLQRTLGATIEVETLLPSGLKRAMADRSQLENAVLNLAINARDAMAQGGKLTISCAEVTADAAGLPETFEPAPDGYVVLDVADTGRGMTADILEHAFEPFFTTKEVGEGSGLGLSMVYGFARQSGGNVTIDSAPGRGTTVRLYLPASDVRQSAPAGDAVPPIRGGQSQMILLVEDNADLRELTETMLHGLGYRTLAVANAAEAEQILARDDPIDLLLTDVVLPGGTNGPELIAKARIRRPGLKALLVSGFPTDDIERQASPAAGVPLLIKPFRKHQLADAVRCALAG